MSAGIGVIIAPIVEMMAPMVGRALGAFFKTTVGMTVLGIGLMVSSYWYASSISTKHALLSLAATLVACVIGGVMLAVKNAIATALSHAIESLDIGAKCLDVVFSQLLGVDNDETHGERGNAAAKVAENLPLQQAEEKLKSVVGELVQASPEGGGISGFFKRKILGSLFMKIEQLTLTEFRNADQSAGGINLVVVRDQLGAEVNAQLLEKTQAAKRQFIISFVLGTMVLSVLLTAGISKLQF